MTGAMRNLTASSHLVALIKPSLDSFTQRKESSLKAYSQTALSLLLVLSCVSRIRNALGLASRALIPTLWNGILSSQMTKQRSWPILATPEMDGWMEKPSRSTRPKSWQTTLSSSSVMLVVQRLRVCKAFPNHGVPFFHIYCSVNQEWKYGLIHKVSTCFWVRTGNMDWSIKYQPVLVRIWTFHLHSKYLTHHD